MFIPVYLCIRTVSIYYISIFIYIYTVYILFRNIGICSDFLKCLFFFLRGGGGEWVYSLKVWIFPALPFCHLAGIKIFAAVSLTGKPGNYWHHNLNAICQHATNTQKNHGMLQTQSQHTLNNATAIMRFRQHTPNTIASTIHSETAIRCFKQLNNYTTLQPHHNYIALISMIQGLWL